MTWMRFYDDFRLGPLAEGSPEALVVLLNDRRVTAVPPISVASRWAASVPTTAFIALDGIDQPDPPSGGLPFKARPALGPGIELSMLDHAAQHLEALLELQLHAIRIHASRLVLVGFGYGGTIALHLLLHRGWSCAGVLAFSAELTPPLPSALAVDRKIRLIKNVDHRCIGQGSLGDIMALLAERGTNARGVSLTGPILSDEAVRHGCSYLVELVAAAQRGDRYRSGPKSRHAP